MFTKGCRVKHEKLGTGTFLSKSTSDNGNAAVTFDDESAFVYRVPICTLTLVLKLREGDRIYFER